MKPIIQRLLPFGLCIAVGACYTVKPLDTTPPAPATHISAQLTDSGTVMMGNALGPGVVSVEGVVKSADRNAWTLRMVSVGQRDGRSILWNHELVSFPSRALREAHVRKLDRRKSWLAAAGITIGAFVAARAFDLLGADDSKDTTPAAEVIVIGVGGN